MSKCELCGHTLTGRERNYKFHKKLFVLFELGFENWEPVTFWDKIDLTEFEKYGVFPRKNKDTFRKDILKLAGYVDVSFNVDGTLNIEAQSISYAKMGADKFEQCYQDCLAVIADRLLKCGRDDLHDRVQMEF